MKKSSTNIKPPKRSSSLVTRITRPIIEQQSQRTISPTSSFSSSILAKGMSERMTPPPPPPPPPSLPKKTVDHQLKSNRRRTIDFSRRRTVTGTSEQNSNKENISIKHQQKSPQDIYRFSPSSSNNNNKVEIHIPSSKHTVTKKYYFHSNTPKPNEDLLNNSYGLTLLKQQQQQEPLQQRHSVAAVLMISQAPNHISSLNPSRATIQQHNTFDSLDDLLCDREVESYFYPSSTSPQSEQIYMNLEYPSDYDQSLSYIHGTLC